MDKPSSPPVSVAAVVFGGGDVLAFDKRHRRVCLRPVLGGGGVRHTNVAEVLRCLTPWTRFRFAAIVGGKARPVIERRRATRIEFEAFARSLIAGRSDGAYRHTALYPAPPPN